MLTSTFKTELNYSKVFLIGACTFLVDNELCCVNGGNIDIDAMVVLQKSEELFVKCCQGDVCIHPITAEGHTWKLNLTDR